jgi:hypothetical protein
MTMLPEKIPGSLISAPAGRMIKKESRMGYSFFMSIGDLLRMLKISK